MNARWMRIAVLALTVLAVAADAEARSRGRFRGGRRGGGFGFGVPFTPVFGGYGFDEAFLDVGPYNTFGFAPVDGRTIIGSGPYDPYRDARDPYGAPVYPSPAARPSAPPPRPADTSPPPPAVVYVPQPAPPEPPEPPREPAQPKTIEVSGEGVKTIKRNGIIEIVR